MKKVILLVEDDNDLRNSMKERIELDGVYQVETAENGYSAYEWLKNNPAPDLVLTDFNMPCRGDILAKSVYRLNIPILMMTCSPERAMRALIEANIRIPVTDKAICLNQILSLIDRLTNTPIKKKQTA